MYASQYGLSTNASFRLWDDNSRGEQYLPRKTVPMFSTLTCTFFQVFTGRVPFPGVGTSAVAMKKPIDGERPRRPPKGRKLGLSNELWETTQSSLAHEVRERPPVRAFSLRVFGEGRHERDPSNSKSSRRIQETTFGSFVTFECGDNSVWGCETMRPSSPSRSLTRWALSFGTRPPSPDFGFCRPSGLWKVASRCSPRRRATGSHTTVSL